LDERIMSDVLAAVGKHGQVSAEDLRQLVRGSNARVDQARRILVASGRLRRVGGRSGGFVLVDVAPAVVR
jgi:hypothetical protein